MSQGAATNMDGIDANINGTKIEKYLAVVQHLSYDWSKDNSMKEPNLEIVL